MLSVEILKGNISDLTDEQYQKIAELSKNDENTVIAAKVREIHDRYDEDFKEVLGIEKPVGEKTYKFWKDEVRKIKEGDKSGDLQRQITDLKKEKSELEKQVKDGKGDEAMKKQIADLTQKVTDKENTITALRGEAKKKEEEYKSEIGKESQKIVELKVGNSFANALQGVKFMDGIPQAAIEATINVAKNNVLSKGKVEFQKDEQGNEIAVFRNDQGTLIANPNNLMKPYTAGEMLLEQLKDVVAKPSKGGGGGPNDPKDVTVLDMSGVQSKNEATSRIRTYLSAQGLQPGSQEYLEQQNKLYTDNKVSEMKG